MTSFDTAGDDVPVSAASCVALAVEPAGPLRIISPNARNASLSALEDASVELRSHRSLFEILLELRCCCFCGVRLSLLRAGLVVDGFKVMSFAAEAVCLTSASCWLFVERSRRCGGTYFLVISDQRLVAYKNSGGFRFLKRLTSLFVTLIRATLSWIKQWVCHSGVTIERIVIWSRSCVFAHSQHLASELWIASRLSCSTVLCSLSFKSCQLVSASFRFECLAGLLGVAGSRLMPSKCPWR